MVRIQQDMKLAEVMEKILTEEYAAIPSTDYKKGLRIQIMVYAVASEAFCNEVEYIISDSFLGNPRIDEIEDLITRMPEDLENVLNRYGIIERAKEFANLNNMADGGAK